MLNLEKFKEDYNWRNAFHVAQYGEHERIYLDDDERKQNLIDSVVKIIAASEGEREGAAWICIVELSDDVNKVGKFAFVDSSCDYTGWD